MWPGQGLRTSTDAWNSQRARGRHRPRGSAPGHWPPSLGSAASRGLVQPPQAAWTCRHMRPFAALRSSRQLAEVSGCGRSQRGRQRPGSHAAVDPGAHPMFPTASARGVWATSAEKSLHHASGPLCQRPGEARPNKPRATSPCGTLAPPGGARSHSACTPPASSSLQHSQPLLCVHNVQTPLGWTGFTSLHQTQQVPRGPLLSSAVAGTFQLLLRNQAAQRMSQSRSQTHLPAGGSEAV